MDASLLNTVDSSSLDGNIMEAMKEIHLDKSSKEIHSFIDSNAVASSFTYMNSQWIKNQAIISDTTASSMLTKSELETSIEKRSISQPLQQKGSIHDKLRQIRLQNESSTTNNQVSTKSDSEISCETDLKVDITVVDVFKSLNDLEKSTINRIKTVLHDKKIRSREKTVNANGKRLTYHDHYTCGFDYTTQKQSSDSSLTAWNDLLLEEIERKDQVKNIYASKWQA